MKREISDIVKRLCKQYDSSDPFTLARQMKVDVIYEPLGTIRGYYSHFSRKKIIHINNALDENREAFVCAHELGHAILHPKSNTPFLRDYTLFSVNKLEIEANRFASCILYSDEELLEYTDYSLDQLTKILGLPPELVKWRYSQIKK